MTHQFCRHSRALEGVSKDAGKQLHCLAHALYRSHHSQHQDTQDEPLELRTWQSRHALDIVNLPITRNQDKMGPTISSARMPPVTGSGLVNRVQLSSPVYGLM